MARCGCSGSSSGCNCAVTAGANVTVTGAGTPGNPYVVSASGVGAVGGSTPSTTTTVTAGNPSVITTDVKLDPAAGNLIKQLPTGLRVSCSDVVGCVSLQVQDTTSVDMTLTGNGTAGNPWVISATTVSDSITVTDTPSVNLSLVGGNLQADVITDPGLGNLLQILPTGLRVDCAMVTDCVELDPADSNVITNVGNGLFVDCDIIGGCTEFTVVDTATIDLTLTGTGTLADPFVLQADLLPEPVITLSAQAKLLGPAGTWTPGADVINALTSVGFSVLAGTADLVDFNGTLSAGLPVSASAQWSAEDENTLIGPQSITANAGSQVLVTWTERP